MREITLHLKVDGSRLCAVCGADLSRPVSNWWLSNSWTVDRRYYCDEETAMPGVFARTCGTLTPNVK